MAVLGDPVRHSLSPAMHNAALQELGLDWVYLALRTPPGRLAAVLAGLEAVECRGLNITLPHKAEAAELARDLSPLAARLGAVNTLVPRAGGGVVRHQYRRGRLPGATEILRHPLARKTSPSTGQRRQRPGDGEA